MFLQIITNVLAVLNLEGEANVSEIELADEMLYEIESILTSMQVRYYFDGTKVKIFNSIAELSHCMSLLDENNEVELGGYDTANELLREIKKVLHGLKVSYEVSEYKVRILQ